MVNMLELFIFINGLEINYNKFVPTQVERKSKKDLLGLKTSSGNG
jgi:hypothetical protein